jgi:hypothetical protein
MAVMGPLAKTGEISQSLNLWLAAFPIGFLFGYALQRAGLTDSRKIAALFYLMAMGGHQLGDVKLGTVLEPVHIVIELPLARRASTAALGDLPIPTPEGDTVPMAELGWFEKVPEDPIIYHTDLRPMEYVVGEMAGRLRAPIYGMLQVGDRLADYRAPDDTGVSAFAWTGEWTVTYETLRDLGLAFAAALVLIYILLVIEFGDFLIPATVMLPIPLTVIGIVPGHWLLDAEFTATYARKSNPLMGSLLGRMQYYWVTSQCEYATDVMFRRATDLKELYRKLVSHSMQQFGAREVMNFLGKKLFGQFRGEVVSDMTDRCKQRLPGTRVKHRAKMNWIKMYDKAGSVLRVETEINQPEAFRVRKRVQRQGGRVTRWVPMRKGVANLFRYRDVSLAATGRYLDALAVVDDPGMALKQLNTITQRKRTRAGQSVKGFNPLSPDDQRAFKALLSGADTINGFRNRDIRARLTGCPLLRSCGRCVVKQSAKISRLLRRFHIYGLIAKVPRTRRWRLTKKGWGLLSAAIALKEQIFPVLYAHAGV